MKGYYNKCKIITKQKIHGDGHTCNKCQGLTCSSEIKKEIKGLDRYRRGEE